MQLLIFSALVGLISWLSTFLTRWLAIKTGILDIPKEKRKIHQTPIPLLGGLGIGFVMLIAIAICVSTGLIQFQDFSSRQLLAFCLALLILLTVGVLDDKYDLRASIRFGLLIVAGLIVIASGTSVQAISGWTGKGSITLPGLTGQLLTFVWLTSVTMAVKFMDGIDGLVTGQTTIGGYIIAALALTTAFYQPSVAALAAIVAGAFLGFLLVNRNPAKQFLGEAGSLIAGFSLGFLSIVSGTKVATALMVLAIPLIDTAFVLVGRMRRGVPLWQGDKTHLHHKLLEAGLNQRQIVFLIWTITAAFGFGGLFLQTQGKMMLLGLLFVLTVGLSFGAGLVASRRKS